jgi:hypothetical protein
MADIVKKVSDLSGKEGTPEEMGRLIVINHPKHRGVNILLDVEPNEVSDLQELGDLVELDYTDPEGKSHHLVVSLEQFNRLAKNMDAVLEDAVGRKAVRKPEAARRPGRPRRDGAAPRKRTPSGTDWTSPEYAGLIHRGKVTDAEADYVRANLESVNANRAAQTPPQPRIDPSNEKDKARYHF